MKKKALLSLCQLLYMVCCLTAFAAAEQNILPSQRFDIPQMMEALEQFKIELLEETEGKSKEESKEIFLAMVKTLNSIVGEGYTWPHEFMAEFQRFLLEHDLYFSSNNTMIFTIPDPQAISETQAIQSAIDVLISSEKATEDELNQYYVYSDYFYRINAPEKEIWTVFFIVPTSEKENPHTISYFVDIDAFSGDVIFVFPE